MNDSSRAAPVHPAWIPLAAIAFVAFVLFADLLVIPCDAVASHIEGDTALNHSRLRLFGITELGKGNIALWNPHIYSGTPYLGGFQAAHLYPLNVPYFFLPIAKALNVDMFLHVFLLGAFMFAWVRNRGLSLQGAFLAAAIVMFSGTCSLRILGGQINVVAAYAWVPLLFLCIDRIFEAGAKRQYAVDWCLVAIFATTMQVLAGAPQVLFMTGLTAGVYSLLLLARNRGRVLICIELLSIAIAPVFLSAIQLWTGFAIGAESTRTGGGTYEFASSFSFPPENLLTLIAPSLFGDRIHVDYWGRWAFWDTSLFMGITGFVLAIYGAAYGDKKAGKFCLLFIVPTVLIALGPSTPIHHLLYDWAPGFDRFRGASKFLFFSTLFASVLAGTGLDALLRKRSGTSVLAGALLGVAAIAVSAALWLRYAAFQGLETNPWYDLLATMKGTPGVFLWEEITEDYVRQTANLATLSLVIAAVTCVALAAFVWLSKRHGWARGAILALGVIELFVFARAYRGEFRISDTNRPELEALYEVNPGDHRVYDVIGWDNLVSNHVVQAGSYGLWGYEPIILSRYAEFLSFAVGGKTYFDTLRGPVFANGADPLGDALHYGIVEFTRDRLTLDPKLLRLLRCRYVIHPPESDRYDSLLAYIRLVRRPSDAAPLEEWRKKESVYELSEPFPHFFLVNEYRVLQERDSIFDALADTGFDPRQTVILEEEPDLLLQSGAELGQVELEDSSTDDLTFRANLTEPAILVITDSYSKGWRGRALPGSVQTEYRIQPANYALRAIPLAAGEHHFKVEYSPAAYRYGKVSTVISSGLFLAFVLHRLFRRVRARKGLH